MAKKKATAKKTKKKTTKKVAALRAKPVKKVKSAKSTKKKTQKKGSLMAPAASMNLEGQMVPSISLPANGGQMIALDGFKGKKVLLYFYPKDLTPGCTIQAEDFTRMHQNFKDLNVEILGISRDDVKLHEKFCAKHNISYPLLSDEDESACSKFGVIKMKNMYGKMVRGIERSTFLIDENGKIMKEWRGVKADGHADEVLGFLKNQA